MPLRLRLIDPVTPSMMSSAELEALRGPLPGGVTLSCIGIENGPPSIETPKDEELAVPGTVAAIVQAERQGYDAAIVACVGDVGVQSARRESSIPVIGPGEASMQLVASWGGRFSILVATESGVPGMRELCERYAVASNLVSVRHLGIPIRSLQEDVDRTADALAEQIELAVRRDGADSVIVGCTAAAPAYRTLLKQGPGRDTSARLIEPLTWSISRAAAEAGYLKGQNGDVSR